MIARWLSAELRSLADAAERCESAADVALVLDVAGLTLSEIRRYQRNPQSVLASASERLGRLIARKGRRDV